MGNQKKLDEIVADYVDVARTDYVGLWQIVIRVRHDFGLSDHEEIRKLVMQIIKGMLLSGLEPVAFDSSARSSPWPNQNVDYVLNRVSVEWDSLGRDPNPGDILWFRAYHRVS
jgi:hypothetical protein